MRSNTVADNPSCAQFNSVAASPMESAPADQAPVALTGGAVLPWPETVWPQQPQARAHASSAEVALGPLLKSWQRLATPTSAPFPGTVSPATLAQAGFGVVDGDLAGGRLSWTDRNPRVWIVANDPNRSLRRVGFQLELPPDFSQDVASVVVVLDPHTWFRIEFNSCFFLHPTTGEAIFPWHWDRVSPMSFVIERQDNGRLRFTLECGQQDFSSIEVGPELWLSTDPNNTYNAALAATGRLDLIAFEAE
jgi:hypothetical protein